MRVRLSGKSGDRIFDTTITEGPKGVPVILLGCVGIPADQAKGLGVELEVVEATPAELAALQAAGFGGLTGVRELMPATAGEPADPDLEGVEVGT